MKTIEEKIITPVCGDYDIIICGSGVAGIAAAIAAKRAGIEKILLIEKTVSFGGLATSGLICLFEPLDDGTGDRVMDGLALEFFRNAIKNGFSTIDPGWKAFPKNGPANPRCYSVFSPAVFSIVLDEMIRKEDIDVILDSHVVSTCLEGNLCTAVIVENRQGRAAYRAKVFVDATGDAIVLDRCGVPCRTEKNWLASICFRSTIDNAVTAAESGEIFKLLQWRNYGAKETGEAHPDYFPMLEGLTSEEVTRYVRESRHLVYQGIKDENPSSRDVIALPSIPQLRKTRRIDGDYTVTESDIKIRHEDSIGVCGDYKFSDRWYEVPLGSLVRSGYPNLITCGRSLSADGWAWDALREIPVCIMTGQAAGIAAATSVIEGKSFKEISVSKIQGILKKQEVRLHK
ncbi:MAG: FAD-dependent oxidoreductase [Spirochaetales bacterium]|nr:FAD-dependent oxidoreductase [Spirochaetales bacterium]